MTSSRTLVAAAPQGSDGQGSDGQRSDGQRSDGQRSDGQSPAPSGWTDRGVNLPSLSVTRLPASALILTSHIVGVGLIADAVWQSRVYLALSKVGYTSVSFFIVLSGFVLTWTAEGTRVRWREFMGRRLVKVLPVHVVAVTVCVVLFAATTFPLPTVLANVALVQAWVPDHGVYFAVNNPAWTLSVELFFYLGFPWLYRVLVVQRTARLWTLLAVAVLAVIALPFVLTTLPDGSTFQSPGMIFHGHLTDLSEWKFWLVYICPGSRIAESVIGMLIALLLKRGAWPAMRLAPVLVLLGAQVTVATLWAPFIFATSAATITGIVALIACVGRRDLARPVASQPHPLARFGRFTFGVYMYQWPLLWMWYLHRQGGGYPPMEALLVFAGLVALIVLATWASHRWVESPIDRWWRRYRRVRADLQPIELRKVSP